MKLSDNLKKLRKSRKLSQKRVAHFTGLTRNMIEQYECGYSEPRLCNLVKLADFYDVTLDKLIR